jgi:hypothetical protein
MRLWAVHDVHSWWGRRWPGTVWAGAAVAVVRLGAPRAVDCIGVAHTRTARLVEADTVFRIASVTKTMTAIGLMQLRESGRFGLDDPVNEYLKSFRIESPPGWPDVTFRHLLTHSGDRPDPEALRRCSPSRLRDRRAGLGRRRPRHALPGSTETRNPGRPQVGLRQETLTEMWAPQFSPDPRVPGMGLAFFLHDFDGHRVCDGARGSTPWIDTIRRASS